MRPAPRNPTRIRSFAADINFLPQEAIIGPASGRCQPAGSSQFVFNVVSVSSQFYKKKRKTRTVGLTPDARLL
jgi:hypothetical protein